MAPDTLTAVFLFGPLDGKRHTIGNPPPEVIQIERTSQTTTPACPCDVSPQNFVMRGIRPPEKYRLGSVIGVAGLVFYYFD